MAGTGRVNRNKGRPVFAAHALEFIQSPVTISLFSASSPLSTVPFGQDGLSRSTWSWHSQRGLLVHARYTEGISSWEQSGGAVGFVLLFDSVVLSPSTGISSSDTHLIDCLVLREACGIHSRKGAGCVLVTIQRLPAGDS